MGCHILGTRFDHLQSQLTRGHYHGVRQLGVAETGVAEITLMPPEASTRLRTRSGPLNAVDRIASLPNPKRGDP